MDDREKSDLIFRLSILKRCDKNLDIPEYKELSRKNVPQLRDLFRYFNERQYKKDQQESERISETLDTDFNRIDLELSPFIEDLDPNTSISLLLKLKPEYVLELLGCKVNLELPIQKTFLDRLNNVVYLVHKFLLKKMDLDGYETTGDVIKSKDCVKYGEIKNILTKYTLLHCNLEQYMKHLKMIKRYNCIFDHEYVRVFREFIADETFVDMPHCPVL